MKWGPIWLLVFYSAFCTLCYRNVLRHAVLLHPITPYKMGFFSCAFYIWQHSEAAGSRYSSRIRVSGYGSVLAPKPKLTTTVCILRHSRARSGAGPTAVSAFFLYNRDIHGLVRPLEVTMQKGVKSGSKNALFSL